MNEIRLIVNGRPVVASNPEMKLLHFLREELGLVGTKNGCDRSQCGACTVIVNKKAVSACSQTMKKLSGAIVETIEGLADDDKLHPLQTAFAKLSAFQCGFCTPGMIMKAKELLDNNPNPTEDEIRIALKRNICRCTGYKKIVEAVQLAARIQSGKEVVNLFDDDGKVGDRTVRTEALRKVKGQPIFTDDFKLVRPLQGKMLFSKYPHARIISVDIEEAKKMPGVAAIALYKDIPGRKDFGQGMFTQQPVIAGDIVRYVGDPVAVVYAESEEQAYAAMEYIKVEYEQLPIINTPEEAMAEGAYKIYEEGNILKHHHTHKGNIDRGFEQSDIIIEDTFSTQRIDHAYMEPDAALAKYDENGLLTVYGSVQNPLGLRRDLAACLAMDEEKIRVVIYPNGGAFGGREEPSVHIQAALGTLLTGRPVRMVFSREELNIFSVKRHPMTMHYKLGATKDGKLLALKVKTVGDTGAYASSGEFVLFRSCAFAAGPYDIPNAWVDSYAVYTNNVTSGSMRGFGSTQPCVAIETLVDRVAEACNIDPFELRKINGLDIGKKTLTGHVIAYESGYQEAVKAVENYVRKDKLPEPSGPNKKIGIGVASSMKNVGLGSGVEDSAWAQMRLDEEGKIVLMMGAVEFGQGCDTIMVQIAAEELGVASNNLKLALIDSDYTLEGGITTASRQTFVTGNATRMVSKSFKVAMLAYVAKISSVPVEFLDCDNEGVYDIRKDKNYRIGYKELAKVVQDNGDDLYEKYYYVAPVTHPMKKCSDNPTNDMTDYKLHFAYSFGVQAVVVEVDELTGKVDVLRVYAANDVGRAINPALVEGQIEGGIAMGIGYALSEKFLIEDGQVVTKQLKDMGLPRSTDVPTDIRTIIVEEKHPYGPFNAKGMGEIPLNPTAPAILNAIYNAVGVRINALPVDAKALAKQINEKKR